MFDISITAGEVLDGRGALPRRADVGIRAGRIEEVGDLQKAAARTTIEAAGRMVCPGFIDSHSHSDAYILVEPSAHSKIFQGVTTEIVGNCGASAAPLTGGYAMPSDWLDKPYPGTWSTVAEYRRLLEQVQPAVNIALLIGHNALRAGVAGYDNRPLKADELARMKALLDQSLAEGGIGLSTGLIYPPGLFAPREEIVELARVAASRSGIYASHMRSESAGLFAAIRETVGIGRSAGVRVQISHLKTSGRGAWPFVEEAIDLINWARAEGVDVAADRYPYTASSTDLDVVLPAWAQEGGREGILRRLRDAGARARLRDETRASRAEDSWGHVVIGSTVHADTHRFRGRSLADAATDLGMEPVDALLRIIELDEVRTGAFFFGMSERNMVRILGEPFVMVGSDASLRSPTGVLGQDYPHPRAYGSFSRVLRMSLDGQLVGLPELVRKMTSLPAEHFRLKDRGVLERGRLADVVVFDPARIRDLATYADPHKLSEGVEHVIVNGCLTLSGGRLTGNRGGQFCGLG